MIVAVARLQPDEIEHYRREGWVVPRYRLPPARVAGMVEALECLLRDNPGVRPEKLVSAHIEGDNGEGVRGSRAFVVSANSAGLRQCYVEEGRLRFARLERTVDMVPAAFAAFVRSDSMPRSTSGVTSPVGYLPSMQAMQKRGMSAFPSFTARTIPSMDW